MANSVHKNQESQVSTHSRPNNSNLFQLPRERLPTKLVRCRPTSAAGILSLLQDKQQQLHEFAIRRLNDIADEFWFEIAESLPLIELCSKREHFGEQKLASLLASKLHYHLGSHDAALKYALGAGELLFASTNQQYLSTITNKCLEYYKTTRQVDCSSIDSRVEFVVDKAFQKCIQEDEYCNAVGFALETKRMDLLQKAILNCKNPSSVLEYAFKTTISLFQNQSFQNSVFECLVEIYSILQNPDYIYFCKCMLCLDDHRGISEALGLLIKTSDDNTLLAYQIAFDLYENATRMLLGKIKFQLNAITHNISHEETVFKSRMKDIASILSGDVTTELYLHFLIRYNHTDCSIFKSIKEECREPICHSAITFAVSLMNYGTTSNRFIIDHIDWWYQENKWAAFSAVAGLGVINKGYESNSIKTLSEYFTEEDHSEMMYREGGSLYALGLIHANHGRMITDYLFDQLRTAKSLEVVHGCCLGIGLAALGTNCRDVYNLVRIRLHQDEATIGESAGIAMGLVVMGSKFDDVLNEMISYAHDTRHEKITRGLAIGIALTMFGQTEKCETVVTTLQNEEDPFLRCAAMHTLAMAYSGTGNNQIVQRLLSVAVNDSNDDVKRAAIQGIGFIFIGDPDKCVTTVSLLSESYNPQVRYGAALALGISCSGTGNNDALSILWELTDDIDDLVCQGALIASSLILIQQTPDTCSKLQMFEDLYQEIAEDVLEDEIVKFGAILALGIINSGGKNVTVSLKSRGGYISMGAVAGMLIFTQYWYWFPLIHFLSLTYLPTCLIGVNAKIKMPQMEFTSNLKSSIFDYPPPMKKRKKSDNRDGFIPELSFAKRMNRKSMDKINTKPGNIKTKGEERKDSDCQSETDFEIILNPARITVQQMRHIQIPEESRYEAVKNISEGGIIVMRDKEKRKSEEFVTSVMIDIKDDDDDDTNITVAKKDRNPTTNCKDSSDSVAYLN